MPREPLDPRDARAARVAALDALARRDLAAQDLRAKLIGKGFDAVVVEPLLAALAAEKLLDDGRFLENFLTYHAGRGQGPLKVRAELRRHGLVGPQVEACISAYPDWPRQLVRAREKRFGAALPNNYAERQRQARFLTYRGFTSAQIRTALGVDIELNVDGDES